MLEEYTTLFEKLGYRLLREKYEKITYAKSFYDEDIAIVVETIANYDSGKERVLFYLELGSTLIETKEEIENILKIHKIMEEDAKELDKKCGLKRIWE